MSAAALRPAVVEADARLVEALRALTARELHATLTWALTDFSSRPAALRILGGADADLTLSVLPALEPLLLVSHSSLAQCRGLVLRLPRQQRVSFLARLTDHVVGTPDSDAEAYRRLAELLRDAGASEPLVVLVTAASASDGAEIREVAVDFSDSTPGHPRRTGSPAPLDLSGAEMVVLLDWLSRSSDAGVPAADLDEAERRVLWDLEAALESRLVAPLSGQYDVLLQQARDDVLGRGTP